MSTGDRSRERAGASEDLDTDTEVAVRCRFDGSWVPGYEIADRDPDEQRFWVRRRTDQVVLPVTFCADELRADADHRASWSAPHRWR